VGKSRADGPNAAKRTLRALPIGRREHCGPDAPPGQIGRRPLRSPPHRVERVRDEPVVLEKPNESDRVRRPEIAPAAAEGHLANLAARPARRRTTWPAAEDFSKETKEPVMRIAVFALVLMAANTTARAGDAPKPPRLTEADRAVLGVFRSRIPEASRLDLARVHRTAATPELDLVVAFGLAYDSGRSGLGSIPIGAFLQRRDRSSLVRTGRHVAADRWGSGLGGGPSLRIGTIRREIRG